VVVSGDTAAANEGAPASAYGPERSSDPDAVGLAPERFAALVAPVIDRVFRGGMVAAREKGGRELVNRHGGSEAVGFLIEFRTALAWPDGVVRAADFAAVLRYRDLTAARDKLATAAGLGSIELTPNGDIRATPRGVRFLQALYDHHAAAMAEHFDGEGARVVRVVEALGVLLSAAGSPSAPNGAASGSALAAMAPPFEPPAAAADLLVLNRLGTLRYHRADAHAAAWGAAGLTAAQMLALPPGPQRDAIEAETNRRAAPPFAALPAPARLRLLADLAALPG
jgi:hypothetical protein